MARFGSLDTQYFDDAGDPLINGKIYFYESGTTTFKDTFADPAMTIPNTNPVILTAAGRQPNVFLSGVAKAVLTKSDDTQVRALDPVGESGGAPVPPEWVSSQSYGEGQLVTGSNGLYYVSITEGNIGNDPTTDAANWTQWLLYKIWNVNETYNLHDQVVGSDGYGYSSRSASNIGNNPVSDLVNWSSGPPTLNGVTINNGGITGSFTEEVYTLTASDIDPENGTIQVKTITAITTFTDSLVDGQSITFQLIDGDLFSVTWPTITWIGTGAVAPGLTGNDFFEVWKIDSVLYGAYVGSDT